MFDGCCCNRALQDPYAAVLPPCYIEATGGPLGDGGGSHVTGWAQEQHLEAFLTSRREAPPEQPEEEPHLEIEGLEQPQMLAQPPPDPAPAPALALQREDTPLPPGCFAATIEHLPGEMIGLDLDIIDGFAPVVAAIKAGVVMRFNGAYPASCIDVHDRLLGANGVSGEPTAILTALKQHRDWRLLIQRPTMFRVEVEKWGAFPAGNPACYGGLMLKYAPNGSSLMISEVVEGPVQDWNAAQQRHRVVAFDRILAVNGSSGAASRLLEVMEGACELNLLIAHYD